MPTSTPAVVCASAIRNFLTDTLDDDFDVRCRYTVCSIGIINTTTGALTECDTTSFYDMVGAEINERITIRDTTLEITRCIVVSNDLT